MLLNLLSLLNPLLIEGYLLLISRILCKLLNGKECFLFTILSVQ